MDETLLASAMAAGLSWASGVRLYLGLFTAGVLGYFGWVQLPPALQVLSSPWVMVVTGLLTAAEFVADKVPGADSVWDAIHTFIRIPAGAILAASAVSQIDPSWTTVAALLGGTLTAGVHATKAGSRALINTSPEPFSNWTASFVEEGAALTGLWATFFHPWLLFAFLAIFAVFACWLFPKVWRGLRWVVTRLKT